MGEMAILTVEDLKKNEEIRHFLDLSERQMAVQGYTEHSYRHVGLVSRLSGRILTELGHPQRTIQLAEIAGYLHDIGNAINRTDHAHTGAILAYQFLTKNGMDLAEASEIMIAIGNHDELTGTAVSVISSALIIADKSDVHRSRVRGAGSIDQAALAIDIHDRVNYAVVHSKVLVDPEAKTVRLDLTIDTAICPVMDYFEIFIGRMTMNRRAARFLGLDFGLVINGTHLL
jgi:metal-dependent HD superfamily phosphatase/phosphodiesterase